MSRSLQGLHRCEWIKEAAQFRGFGHELGDALRSFGTHGVRIEPAFLPDQADEIRLRQAAQLRFAESNFADGLRMRFIDWRRHRARRRRKVTTQHHGYYQSDSPIRS